MTVRCLYFSTHLSKVRIRAVRKTTVQMTAIPFLLYNGQLFDLIDTRFWGNILLWLAVVLTVWSMAYYMRKAIPEIRQRIR